MDRKLIHIEVELYFLYYPLLTVGAYSSLEGCQRRGGLYLYMVDLRLSATMHFAGLVNLTRLREDDNVICLLFRTIERNPLHLKFSEYIFKGSLLKSR